MPPASPPTKEPQERKSRQEDREGEKAKSHKKGFEEARAENLSGLNSTKSSSEEKVVRKSVESSGVVKEEQIVIGEADNAEDAPSVVP